MNRSLDQVSRYRAPGVHIDSVAQEKKAEFKTGIPVFVGFGKLTSLAIRYCKYPWCRITSWQQFEQNIELTPADSYLTYAVRGFFENGGECCVIVPVSVRELTANTLVEPFLDTLSEKISDRSSTGMLGILEDIGDIDLVCAPDLMMETICTSRESVIEAQQQILRHCKKMGDRFAILDTFPVNKGERHSFIDSKSLNEVIDHRYYISGSEGAVYFPWICIHQGVDRLKPVPPCGHVAGIYARSDAKTGVFKAPANEIIEGAFDLEVSLTNKDLAELNHAGVNCFRSSPSRGIRVWGARTLSVHDNDQFITTRRLFLTLVRWIEKNMSDLVFETNDASIWNRIKHRLEGYCYELFQKGALKGQSPEEAYYVKCDRELNSIEVRELGQVISEVGLASVVPAEFIIVRITQSASGIATTALSLN
ncbi:MAG: phage tail sheath subtilisin-like domain-containing protein [Methylococcaceae bacterium]